MTTKEFREMYKTENIIYILDNDVEWSYEANVYFTIPRKYIHSTKILTTIIENEITYTNAHNLSQEILLITNILNKSYQKFI